MTELKGPRLPELNAVRRLPDGAEFDLVVPADLVWFRGHFSGTPILPGVVQIDWAVTMARTHLAIPGTSATAVRVKFHAVIRPTDRLTLTLRLVGSKDAVDFEYRNGERPCSSGRVRIQA